jgi:hypothetical protein
LSYKDAHKIVEKIIGLVRSSKEAMVKEMVILDNREEVVAMM